MLHVSLMRQFRLGLHLFKMVLFVAVMFSVNGIAAGLSKVEVPASDGESALRVVVWSPCASKSTLISLGSFNVQGVMDCLVEGNNLPLVVISHGKGASSLSHHDTASALADAGFVVVTFNHPGDSFGDETSSLRLSIFETRVRDVSRIISFMTQQWNYRDQLNEKAVGVFGFSRGGYTALALAGAIPDRLAGAKHVCDRKSISNNFLCRSLKDKTPALHPKADVRIQAIVAVDPLNLFDTQGLQSVRVPVQLWASQYGGDGVSLNHMEAIKDALPLAVDYRVAQGAGHFAYLAPCSPLLQKENPDICVDPKGFDRTAWHTYMNTAVIDFFKQHLRGSEK